MSEKCQKWMWEGDKCLGECSQPAAIRVTTTQDGLAFDYCHAHSMLVSFGLHQMGVAHTREPVPITA